MTKTQATRVAGERSVKTFYVEICAWVTAKTEDDARAVAEVIADIATQRLAVTSATVNTVEEQDDDEVSP